MPARSSAPTRAAFSRRPSRSMTSSTASPAAQETGLPPVVLKKWARAAKRSASSRRITSAPMGWPFPIGLPRVTMSGTTPAALVAPHVGAAAAEARLHLVRDEEPARRMHPRPQPLQVAGRGIDDAVAGEHGVHEERGGGVSSRRQGVERAVGERRVALTAVRDAPVPGPAVLVGRRQGGDVGSELGGAVFVLGGEGHERGGDAVIGPLHDERAAVAGARLRDAPREVVGLAAGGDHEAGVELRRHGPGEAFRVLHQRLVEVARVGVEAGGLAGDRVHHVGVAVADLGHVVVRVEPGLAVRPVEPDPFRAHHVHRPLVAEAESGREARAPPREQRLARIPGRRFVPRARGGAQARRPRGTAPRGAPCPPRALRTCATTGRPGSRTRGADRDRAATPRAPWTPRAASRRSPRSGRSRPAPEG